MKEVESRQGAKARRDKETQRLMRSSGTNLSLARACEETYRGARRGRGEILQSVWLGLSSVLQTTLNFDFVSRHRYWGHRHGPR